MPNRITLTPLCESLGMKVEGLLVSQPIDDTSYRKLRDALVQHSVLLFRDQDISPKQLVAFSLLFGPIERHILQEYAHADEPDVFVVSNVVENGRQIGTHGGGRDFHSDMSYQPIPSLGSLFYCVECPAEGGQTEFASMFAAYDALSDDTQDWLTDQHGVHDYAYHYATKLTHRKPLTDEQKAKLAPAVHPAVRTHPESGRNAIYISEGLTRQFEGMTIEESQPKIKDICDFATQPRFVYRHEWRPGDLIFWDNRSVMHRAIPFDDKKYRRLMHRTTLKGDKPIFTQTQG